MYPKKSLGQNFLQDKNIIKKIVEIGNINSNTVLLEIGPGTGNLTNEIINKDPKKIYLIEKDKNLYLDLKDKFKNNKNIFLFNDDALKFNEKQFENEQITLFGNLPFNISTQLLAKWILIKKWPPWYNKLILMFQKEVADRIVASFGTKDYGRLSILSNWRLDIKKHFDISRDCFFPRPKIDSTLLSFVPIKKDYFQINDPKKLEQITRIFFSNKRKMINKAFNRTFQNDKKIINDLNLNLNLRPANLKMETYYKLAQKYEKLAN